MVSDDEAYRSSPPFTLNGEELFIEVIDTEQTVGLCRWPSKEVVEQTVIPLSHHGCHLESFLVSPSGKWVSTERLSGQGDWGYEILQTSPLRWVGGAENIRGYINEPPRFAADESRYAVFGSLTLRWVEDTTTVFTDGGWVNVGWLYLLRIPHVEVSDHEVVVRLTPGWKAEQRSQDWHMPKGIEPVGDGLRIHDWCGQACDIPGPLPETIVLPTPHPSGKGHL